MFVRDYSTAKQSERCVQSDNWDSTRLILKDDGFGFSFHITTIYAGTETRIWYRNHLETVFCITGEGEVETLPDNTCYPIRPGTLYALDSHDEHLLRAKTTLRLACVFNPPLVGDEVHDENGVYPLEEEANPLVCTELMGQ